MQAGRTTLQHPKQLSWLLGSEQDLALHLALYHRVYFPLAPCKFVSAAGRPHFQDPLLLRQRAAPQCCCGNLACRVAAPVQRRGLFARSICMVSEIWHKTCQRRTREIALPGLWQEGSRTVQFALASVIFWSIRLLTSTEGASKVVVRKACSLQLESALPAQRSLNLASWACHRKNQSKSRSVRELTELQMCWERDRQVAAPHGRRQTQSIVSILV